MGLFQNPPVQNTYQSQIPVDLGWRYMSYSPSLAAASASVFGTGTTPTEAAAAGANTVATATALAGRSLTTATTLNAIASWVVDPIHNYSNSLNASWQFALDGITARRFWVGFADVAPATMAASDTPSQSYVGFRFSTGASDTLWRCMTDNGSGAPTNVSSGIAAATGNVILSLVGNPASTIFYVNGVIVGQSAAKLPSTATNTLRPFFSVTNLTAGVARAFTIYFFSMRSKVI